MDLETRFTDGLSDGSDTSQVRGEITPVLCFSFDDACGDDVGDAQRLA